MCCYSFNYLKFRRSIESFLETHRGCSVEMGTFIYTIVHNFLTGLTSVISIVWLVGHVFYYFILGNSYASTLPTDLLLTAIASGSTTIAVASFVFGMVLARGLLAKRPGLMRAYLTYGVMVVTVCAITSVSLGVTSHRYSQWAHTEGLDVYGICALIVAGACVLYSSILVMIWITYRRVQKLVRYSIPITTFPIT